MPNNDLHQTTPIHILWVDDEPAQLLSTSDYLQSEGHLTIDFASTVAVALRKLADGVYDIIVVDVLLPVGELPPRRSALGNRLNLYGDRAGLGLLEILCDGTLDDSALASKPSTLPIIVSSNVEDSLLQDYERLRKENVLVCSKSEFVFAPKVLLDLIGTCVDISVQPEEQPHHVPRKQDYHDPELQKDDRVPSIITRLLHDHSSALLTITSAIKRATTAIGPSPFDKSSRLPIEEISDFLGRPAHSLLFQIENIYNLLIDKDDSVKIPGRLAKDLLANIERLRMLTTGGIVLQVEQLADLLVKIKNQLPSFRGIAPKVPIKKIKAEAEELDKRLTLYHLHQALLRIQEIEIHAQFLLDDYKSSPLSKTSQSTLDLAEIVLDVKAHLATYSRLRHVEIRLFKRDARDRKRKGIIAQEFFGDRQAITRALRNVVHNGIKYSYYLRGDRPPWVDVITGLKDGTYFIEVESWGVPIPAHEIESGDIFIEGFRGKEANDRGRGGSGIGLADAARTMKFHDGAIEIRSEPRKSRRPQSAAFITTVKMLFPLG